MGMFSIPPLLAPVITMTRPSNPSKLSISRSPLISFGKRFLILLFEVRVFFFVTLKLFVPLKVFITSFVSRLANARRHAGLRWLAMTMRFVTARCTALIFC